MPTRKSQAIWEGSLKEGKGRMMLGSGAFEGKYSFGSRFEEEPGTNPEELIAAAHAGCFTMFLSSLLTDAGFTPRKITTTAKVNLAAGPEISKIELETEADVPGISDKVFQEQALIAKKNCPISKALSAVPEITLSAKLV
ncbi:MAG TPA: OsmC family protein [Flexilinea sp.]|jgi:osmotically inducible protein OsmC|nr:MAG: Peroxiredoxin OsmC [Chloroflexi bacterium ADurb.Bin344]HOG22907.1 OsmC family protein [Flexilinea sp.]HOP01494.1 OsmC family protein [Flexilinea sp.]HOR56804.1 OsmC family protein [Flexilinea sp.]HOU20190.1 OsmC family protein [Flexilinea sp.]